MRVLDLPVPGGPNTIGIIIEIDIIEMITNDLEKVIQVRIRMKDR
jgi:hypothetical protein